MENNIASKNMNSDGSDPCMSSDILVHVGLHKTGTTWLQWELFEPQDKGALDYCNTRDLIRGTIVVPVGPDFDVESARENFRELIKESNDSGRLFVITDEILAGYPFHHPHLQEVSFSRIKAMFPNAKILISVREQAQVILSIYGQYLRFGFTSNLNRFLRQPEGYYAEVFHPVLSLEYYDYQRLFHYASKVFGEDAVMMAPLEYMMAETEEFLGRLEKHTGHKLQNVSANRKQKIVNAALSGQAYQLMRFLNYFYSQDSRWQFKQDGKNFLAGKVASRFDRLVPKSARQRKKEKELALVRSKLSSNFAQSNRELSLEIDVDLEKYGYQV
ncbi:sulfotransferase domain-containing protein [Pseudooceanicola nitratireducens]|uniref:sulfotransferase domain-containing protein n=1 Tax=Pseudooceanicola nitratireducens TaxID=517719 RepID=UPI001C979CA7|nr:sulfotransferase domain-containing protein [Pseudooceanicola nitratireducens]MBY6165702.1 sulfotransferase domain-containing protein [Pseudooceanicola nitratireducens]